MNDDINEIWFVCVGGVIRYGLCSKEEAELTAKFYREDPVWPGPVTIRKAGPVDE